MLQTTTTPAMDVNSSGFVAKLRLKRKWLAVGVLAALAIAVANLEAGKSKGSEATKNGLSTSTNYKWEKQDSEQGIALVLQVSKMAYRVGEGIQGEVFISNNSRKVIKVYLPGLTGAITRLLKADTKEGVPPQAAPMVFGRVAKGGESDWFTLDPGDCFGRKFHIDGLPLGDFHVSAFYKTSAEVSAYFLVAKSPPLKVTD
jgi:hypothetical protein